MGEVYQERLEQRGSRAAARLQAVGDSELPDTVFPKARRMQLKKEVRTDAERLSVHEAMYKAGAYEMEARAKRTRESLAG